MGPPILVPPLSNPMPVGACTAHIPALGSTPAISPQLPKSKLVYIRGSMLIGNTVQAVDLQPQVSSNNATPAQEYGNGVPSSRPIMLYTTTIPLLGGRTLPLEFKCQYSDIIGLLGNVDKYCCLTNKY